MAYCYQPSSVICQSVTLVNPAKNGWTDRDRDTIWVMDSDGPKEACIRWVPYPPCEGAVIRGKAKWLSRFMLC